MITYTNATTQIAIQYPRTWDVTALTDVTLQIADVEGNELQAATSAALYTQTTLADDATRFSRTIEVAAAAADLEIGDVIRIAGVNGYETHTVRGYDATNKIATLELTINRDFETGATVDRLTAISTVDLSDTDTYPPGIQLMLTWAPTGTGDSFTTLAEIEADSQIDLAEFTKDFKAVWPRAYNALKEPADRLDIVLRLAQDELRMTLATRGLDIARVKDQRLLNPPLMTLVARYWTLNGDENLDDERKVINSMFSANIEALCKLPIWVDTDGDGILDDGEDQSHPVYFERVW